MMPKAHKGRPATHARAGVGVTRAHTAPLGIAPVYIVDTPDDAAQVEKPARSATKAVWVEYATLVLGDDLSHLTKAEIVDVVEATE